MNESLTLEIQEVPRVPPSEADMPTDLFPALLAPPPGPALPVIMGRTILDSSATFSDCRQWRYELWRRWTPKTPGNYCMFIGLNPSTADEHLNDPTVGRCIRFAMQWGYDSLCMTNLFAYRATLPKDMKRFPEPVGPWNDDTLVKLAEGAGIVILAWGNHGSHLGRAAHVLKLLEGSLFKLHHLGTNSDGSPKHPLYLKSDTKPIPLCPPDSSPPSS